MIDKRVRKLSEAVAGVKDGATVLCSGFGAVGEPVELLNALRDSGVRDLVCVANNAGTGDEGLAGLIAAGRVRKIICSFPRTTDPHCFEAAYKAGKIELELVPQGTLSERMRAAARGRRRLLRQDQRRHQARRRQGDARDRRRALCAGAADQGRYRAVPRRPRRPLGQSHLSEIGAKLQPGDGDGGASSPPSQVREMVDLGALDPECVVTPGIFVDRVVVVWRGGPHEAVDPSPDGVARRAGHRRRHLRQSRHRPSHHGLRFHPGRPRDRLPQRERHPRHGRRRRSPARRTRTSSTPARA